MRGISFQLEINVKRIGGSIAAEFEINFRKSAPYVAIVGHGNKMSL